MSQLLSSHGLILAVSIGYLASIAVIRKIWSGTDHCLMKCGLTLVALVPLLGPLLALWIAHTPEPMAYELQDQSRYTTDVQDRWRPVIDEKRPISKFQKWKATIGNKEEDEREP